MCHLSKTICQWKLKGLLETRERMEEIYWIRESSTECEKCGKEFKSPNDRCMDHCHDTGRFRNILCNSCNAKRCKISKNNKSGYLNICKISSKTMKHGFTWVFQVYIDGKEKYIKSSKDLEYLNEFAIKWRKDNNYNN